ncbi:MAG: alginate export family protein [Bacteroidales bacterium]|nr:alginate export family protein [Bacteroidales bacterium]
MKKFYSIILFAGILLMSAYSLTAQDLYIDAEFRPRAEFREGMRSPLTTDQTPSFVLLNRTRLKLGFESKWINAKITLQDSRVWGQDNINAENIGLNLYEGWVELHVVQDLNFTIGRQILAYDYNRLFSASSWTNTGKSHDLALLKYTNHDWGFRADLGFAYNNPKDVYSEQLFNDEQNYYQTLSFLRFEETFASKFKASAIFVGEGFQNIQTDENGENYIDGHFGRYTTGANFEMKDKEIPVDFTLTGYYQFGKNLSQKELNAYFFAATVTAKLAKPLSLYVGTDVYSGSDNDSKQDNTWDKLYGSNHSFNGSMEYWRSLPNEGLVDIYGGLKCHFLEKKLTADLGYHFMMTEKEIRRANLAEAKGHNLGSELDLKLQYSVVKNVMIEGGWSTYFNSANTKLLKGLADTDTRFQQWAYVSLIINPQLFNTKNLKN